jgi:hypothetical protein
MAVPDGQQALRLGVPSWAKRLATASGAEGKPGYGRVFFWRLAGVQRYNLLITWVSAKP